MENDDEKQDTHTVIGPRLALATSTTAKCMGHTIGIRPLHKPVGTVVPMDDEHGDRSRNRQTQEHTAMSDLWSPGLPTISFQLSIRIAMLRQPSPLPFETTLPLIKLVPLSAS